MNKPPVEAHRRGAGTAMSLVATQVVKLSMAELPPSPPSPPPRLLDRLRQAIRVRHFSIRTEQTYVDCARRFILFHGKRHPQDMGAAEVEAFLTHLAVDEPAAAYAALPGAACPASTPRRASAMASRSTSRSPM